MACVIKEARRSWPRCYKKTKLNKKYFLYSTCGDAVEGQRHQVVNLLVQLCGRAFTVNLVHCSVGAVHPLHQPLQLTVTGELVASQVSEERRPNSLPTGTFLNGKCRRCPLALTAHEGPHWRTEHLQRVMDYKPSLFLTAACNFNGAKSTTHSFVKPRLKRND